MEPRLFVEADLDEGCAIALGPEQAGYLLRVLRLAPGDAVRLFNGRHGEWRARIVSGGKRGADLLCQDRLRRHANGADIALMFAPLKRQAGDWLVEKATELGAAALRPVLTRRTVAETVRLDRFAAIAREAAEQCERLDVPSLSPPIELSRLLEQWDETRRILFADEAGSAPPALHALATLRDAPRLAVLIGPEGGFDPAERAALRARPFVQSVTLGPRILRAETAAVCLLSLVQGAWGDWGALPREETSRT